MASIAATIVDYLVSMVLAGFFTSRVVIAGVTGTICGGIFNFLTARHWVFEAAQYRLPGQAMRYLLVWTGSLVFTTTGLYVLAVTMGAGFFFSKASVSLLVAVSYNYPLQKRFVFKHNRR